MARNTQRTTTTAGNSIPFAETNDIAQLVEDLDGMLTRLRLGAIRTNSTANGMPIVSVIGMALRASSNVAGLV